MQLNKAEFDTLCASEMKLPETIRPSQLPIYATSSFAFDSIDEGIDTFLGKTGLHFYSRYGNPTLELVAEKIAKMESFGLADEAVGIMTSSGMSAIATLLAGILKSGDKILTQGNLYGGTTELFNKVLAPLGLQPVYVNLENLDEVEAALKAAASIRMIYCETPSNPTLACVDLAALASLAKQYQCYSVADNTFCTPYIQRPLHWGFDFVIHSTTKYLNGHGTSIGGCIIGKDLELMKAKVWQAMKLFGTNLSPFEAWLTNSGMKTLHLRMERHSSNALALAKALEAHPSVEKVNYPGLESFAYYELAQKQMSLPGGMLSFELKGGLQSGIKFMNGLKHASLAPTLGDCHTLILHPASMSHVNIAKEIRENNGITDGLIRVSVGIEAEKDILDDVLNAIG